jgi:CBS domain-containing protein
MQRAADSAGRPVLYLIQDDEGPMFDRPVKDVMRREKLLKAPPETPVGKVAKLMESKSVGAVMVIAEDRLVGICTERDIVFRVVAKGLDADATRLADVMTAEPQTVAPDKPFGYALLLMHERGFRHLPVVQDGKVIGMVSSRSALDPSLEEFVSEEQRRKHFKEKG